MRLQVGSELPEKVGIVKVVDNNRYIDFRIEVESNPAEYYTIASILKEGENKILTVWPHVPDKLGFALDSEGRVIVELG